ncbi:MAG: lyase family protein, partial [Proteobacteria bacterium]|nr:lyase family protein [Pseudomonadota bacterium]
MTKNETSSIWGGRFEGGPSKIMEQINASIDFDRRLYAQDIAASKAHCAMLAAQDIISEADGTAITGGLNTILGEIEAGTFEFKSALEDIHMNVESRLTELIREAA